MKVSLSTRGRIEGALSSIRSCVIVVENLPVPMDRRVWQEALALADAGWLVSVICPKHSKYPASYEVIENIAIYRHSLPIEARGRWAFLIEYAAALFHQFRLLLKVRRERGFAVIQACNPPDLIFLAALPFKLLGAYFVFDQHDLSPELYAAKFRRKDFVYKILYICERLTYATADAVITANRSYRNIAIRRGRKRPENVEAIYSIPSTAHIFRGSEPVGLRQGSKFLLGYVGIINDQDGVDHLIRAVHNIVSESKFTDFRLVIVGDGPALPSVRALAEELNVQDFVIFTGYLTGKTLIDHLSAFDIGVIPDPLNDSNNLMSMNKVFEYSALGIPAAAYPLAETKNLLGNAAVYAPTLDPAGLAESCLLLMRDETLRANCASKAKRLARENFIWEREAEKYVAVFERLAAAGAGPSLERAAIGQESASAKR
jgi:glycosyltransferase involved in cell wall biosynthesis